MAKKPKETPLEKVEGKKRSVGAPIKYTPELGVIICEAVATTTFGLRKMCKLRADLPGAETIREWRIKYPEFSGRYAQAKIQQADLLAEDCLDISDENSQDIKINEQGYEVFNGEFVARARLRIDTRKWLASKLLPKLYGGDKELQDTKDKNLELQDEVRRLRAKLDAENLRDY